MRGGGGGGVVCGVWNVVCGVRGVDYLGAAR